MKTFYRVKGPNWSVAQFFNLLTWYFSVGFRWSVGRLNGRSDECQSDECQSVALPPNSLDCAFAEELVKNNVGNLSNSDRCLIKIELDFAPFNCSSEKVFDWHKGDEEGLKNHPEIIDFVELFQEKNANTAWLSLKGVIDDSNPLSRYTFNRKA